MQTKALDPSAKLLVALPYSKDMFLFQNQGAVVFGTDPEVGMAFLFKVCGKSHGENSQCTMIDRQFSPSETELTMFDCGCVICPIPVRLADEMFDAARAIEQAKETIAKAA